MIVGGCDVGSTTGKAVIIEESRILAHFITPSTTKPEQTARAAMEEAVKMAGLSSVEQLGYVVGTGYGRTKVPFANENISEITCHARGAHWMNPTVRTVVDIGGQDCKVIALDAKGKVLEFAMNDRCAAGTGRFFEAMARVLGCGLEGISALENQGAAAATISSQCSVFAESEVVTLINEGVDLPNIIAGINNSVANRLYSMVRRVGLNHELVLTGGCSKNAGLAKALEKRLGVSVTTLPQDPQIAGAVGAALIASEKGCAPASFLGTAPVGRYAVPSQEVDSRATFPIASVKTRYPAGCGGNEAMDTNIKSTAFAELAAATAAIMNPAIAEWKAGGGKVVGHFCSHVPVEVMTAAGVMPFRMRGTGSDGTELSDASFSSINCSFPRHTFNQALRGEYDFLDGLICISSCDHVRRVYDNWKQQLKTPFLTIMSLPKKIGDPQVDWYYDEINLLRDALGTHFGVEITDERLQEAIKLVNETRRLQRQLYELRKRERPPISGAEALAVMVAGSSMPREHYNHLLRTLLADLETQEGKSGHRARLMIVGSELDDPEYVQVIEDQGGLVVTDSICFGTRTMWVDASETEPDPVRALARYYIQERPSCPRMNGGQPARAAFLQDMVKEFSVDGVIGERMLFCDFWCAEHYMNKADFKEAGIPFIQIDREYLLSGRGQLQTRIQAFLETMGR